MSKQQGDNAEELAVKYLQSQGLTLLAKNYQPSGRGVSDLDIVMQDPKGTVVFIEVKYRESTQFGGAGGSVSIHKQRRLIQAAQYFLMQFKEVPACRFDVVAFEGGEFTSPLWLKGAFEV